jgi:hypothetical protein
LEKAAARKRFQMQAPPSDPAGLTLSNKANQTRRGLGELLQSEVEKRLPRHLRKIRATSFVDRHALCDKGESTHPVLWVLASACLAECNYRHLSNLSTGVKPPLKKIS